MTGRGVNLHPIWYPDAKIDQVCQLLAGVPAVRIDFPLNFLFPAKGQMHPGYLERLTRFAKGCPSEILGIAAYTPGWANGNWPYNVPWTSPQDFAATVAQLVEVFPQVKAWEVWNEPDLSYSWATASGTLRQRAEAYVRLLEAASPVIRAAGARVVAPAVSGLSSAPWLSAFYHASPHGLYDVVSSHVYGDPPLHGNLTPADMMQAWTASVWPVLAVNGDGLTELWMTETGWSTISSGVTVDQQAQNLIATFAEIDRQAPNVRRVYWYELLDDRSGTTAPADYYGLLDVNCVPKAAWAAFNALS